MSFFQGTGSPRATKAKTPASPSSPSSSFQTSPVLPSFSDRLALYDRLRRAVEVTCRSCDRLVDPRTLGFFQPKDNSPDITSFGRRHRQLQYLRLEFLPMCSAALLLEMHEIPDATLMDFIEDAGGNSGSCSNNSNKQLDQPVATITLLLSNMVLVSQGNYDARARAIVKEVCVQVLLLQQQQTSSATTDPTAILRLEQHPSRALYELTQRTDDQGTVVYDRTVVSPKLSPPRLATIQFESIELAIATDIVREMIEQNNKDGKQRGGTHHKRSNSSKSMKTAPAASTSTAPSATSSALAATTAGSMLPRHLRERFDKVVRNRRKLKEHMWRGLKIGGVGVVVGSLFAVTGGLAGPGLVAAIAAFGINSSAVVFATLTTTTALASMFGVVGGGLGAYKMSKRVKGLSEWRIRKETKDRAAAQTNAAVTLRGMHAHVCVSGWLREPCDFQRPFGVRCTDPQMPALDSLQRFLCVHQPDKVAVAKTLLKATVEKGAGSAQQQQERHRQHVWIELARRNGGISPDDLMPLDRSDEPALLTPETEAEIYTVLMHCVLDEASATQLKKIYETSTMLVQMEAKNQEALAMFSSHDSFALSDEDQEEEMRLLKTQALLVAAKTSTTYPNETASSPPPAEPATDANPNAVQHDLDREVMFDAENITASSPPPVELAGDSNPNAADYDLEEKARFDTEGVTSAGDSAAGPTELDTAAISDTPDAGEKPLWSVTPTKSLPACDNTPKRSNKPAGDAKEVEPGHDQATTNLENNAVATDEAVSVVVVEGDILDKAKTWEADDSDGIVTVESTDSSGDQPGAVGQVGKTETASNDTEDELQKESQEQDKGECSQLVWDFEATYAGEMYTLSFETSFLLKLCRVATVLVSEIGEQVSKQLLTNALVGAAAALPSALMTCAAVIDDPYQIIVLRSDIAGIELAHCLLTSEEHRPISLVGFSFGARVIYSCLLELAKHQLVWQERKQAHENGDRTDTDTEKDAIKYLREPASIVEDVVLMGMPRTIDVKSWISCREIVAGRLVNCFSRKDWIVSYMINVRCIGGIRKTCGTHPVEDIHGVENFEVSDLVSSHDRYLVTVPQILHKVGYSQPLLPP